MLTLIALLATAQAAPVDQAVQLHVARDNRVETGFELISYAGVGARVGVNLDGPVDSIHLRVGVALESARLRDGYLTFNDQMESIFPLGVLWSPGLVAFAGPAVDLQLWGPLELELTAGAGQSTDASYASRRTYEEDQVLPPEGPAAAPDPSWHPVSVAGLALKLDLERDNPVTGRIGVLAAADGDQVRFILDAGPTFTW